MLFGGGELIYRLAQILLSEGIRVLIFAVPRHLDENVDVGGEITSLRSLLKSSKINFFEEIDINKSVKLKSIVTKNAIGIGLGEAYTFDQSTIDLFNDKIFDLMTIRLPQFRGGAHFTWQILQNNRLGAWCLQEINTEMIPGVYDSGRILKSTEFIIPKSARIPADFFKVYNLNAEYFFKSFLSNIKERKDFQLTNVQEGFSSYFPRLNTSIHGFINWNWDVNEIERFICAFDNPYKGASTYVDGVKVYLKGAQSTVENSTFHPFMAGIIYKISNNNVFVSVNGGSLIVESISNESGEDCVKNIRVGMRLVTPVEFLERALSCNADYDGNGLVN